VARDACSEGLLALSCQGLERVWWGFGVHGKPATAGERIVVSIRAWLAGRLGCDPARLRLLAESKDGRDAIFELDGDTFVQVHLLSVESTFPNRSVGIVAAWAAGSANEAIRADIDVEW
jgi:hypothetical protein